MPLAAALEELLKKLSPEEAATQRKILEAHPELGEGWMRQSDYDRQMNQSKDEIKVANEERDKWKGWVERNKPRIDEHDRKWDAMENENKELREKVEAAAKAAAAAGGGNGNGTVDSATVEAKVLDRIKGMAYVTNADVVRIAGEETKKVIDEQVKHLNEVTNPGLIEYTLRAQQIALGHFKEFGDVMTQEDRMAIAKVMKDTGNPDPIKAYNEWIGPRRTEVAKKTQEAAVNAEVEKRVKEEMAKRNVPGSPVGIPPELGPLSIRIQKQDPLADKEVSLGDGQLAAAASAELRAEGKI